MYEWELMSQALSGLDAGIGKRVDVILRKNELQGDSIPHVFEIPEERGKPLLPPAKETPWSGPGPSSC